MKREFTVTMYRPDRKRPITRKFIDTNVRVASDRQLFGYVNHKVFTDRERGGNGTVYVMRDEREDGATRVITMRKESGGYTI